MRVGVPQVEARQRDEDAAGYRLLSSGRGVRSALLGYCRDCHGRDRAAGAIAGAADSWAGDAGAGAAG